MQAEPEEQERMHRPGEAQGLTVDSALAHHGLTRDGSPMESLLLRAEQHLDPP